MKTFLIDSDNHIVVYACEPAARAAASDNAVVFSTHANLTHDSAPWPAGRLVQIWNRIPGVVAVKKFTDRKTALHRIWNAIQALEPAPLPDTAGRPPAQPREGTKKATVLAMLERPAGATVQEIVAALGWQSHSVRGFLSSLGKSGTPLRSFTRPAGERAYTSSAIAVTASQEAE